MNKKIAAAVSSAALVLGSTAANAGIIIPAGEWTLDINGNVNAYATHYSMDDTNGVGLALGMDGNEDNTQSINTGLLPAWLGFTATTRQNDLDVSWTISMQPNVSNNGVTGDNGTNGPLWRQAFLTFGDKSWGTVKAGKDLGIFAGNAILNDMTLLGVGAGFGNSGTSTTLGGIGSGYVYPAWKGQIAYTTPNFNGFSATVAITNPNQNGGTDTSTGVTTAYQDRFGLEAQAQFAFDAGKVWVSGASYKLRNGNSAGDDEWDANAVDVGASVNFGNLGLVAYYYSTEGVGTTMWGGFGDNTGGLGDDGKERDGDGGYLQATYVIPSGTKLGVAYGVSNLDRSSSTDSASTIEENKRWTVGAYHPLTKHLNLVAEYNNIEGSNHNSETAEMDQISLGAILFF